MASLSSVLESTATSTTMASSETVVSASNPIKPPTTTLSTLTTSIRRTTTATTPYTSFLLLTSVPRSTTGCSSNIYKGPDGGFTGWDPDYGSTYERTATSCHATVVTSWYDQGPAATPIALGSSSGTWFTCPSAYSTVTPPAATTSATAATASASTADEGPTLVMCCPSGYTYNTTATVSDYRPGYFPSQCYSLLTPSQSLRYMTLPTIGARLATVETTTIPADATLTVYGIPVNGFTATRTSATSRATSTSSSSSPSSSSSSSRARDQLPLILGLTFGLLFILMLFICFVRWKKTKLAETHPNHVEAARPLQPSVTEQRGDTERYGVRDSHDDDAPPSYGLAAPPPYKP